MSKKSKKTDLTTEVAAEETMAVNDPNPKSAKAKPADKNADKKAKDKKKKKERKHTVAKKTKETVSELKKVTWPTFKEVVKKTGVVLVVVLIFAVVLFGIDYLLGLLFGLLAPAA